MESTTRPNDQTSSTSAIQRWVKFWNLISLGSMLIITTLALRDSPDNTPLILGFALLYALWYGYFIIRLACWGRSSLLLASSFAVIILAMAGMTRFNSLYTLLLFSHYGLIFSVLGTRLAVPLSALISVLGAWLIIRTNQMTPPESYGVMIGFGFAAFLSIMMGLFISAIMRQSFERQQIIEELQAAREGLARAEREAGIFEERQRLAREIHDTLAQGFTSVVMHLEAADQALVKAQPQTQAEGEGQPPLIDQPQPAPDPSLRTARQHLDRARATARDSLAEARRFVWALRSEPLERETLAQAIGRVAQRWAEETGIQTQVEISGDERPLPSPYEVTLLRTVQEALANIRKHAAAQQVTLTLTYMDDQVILDVQDDGHGFDPEQVRPAASGDGFGLLGMRERAEQLGGSLIIESAPGEGTTLVVDLPLTAP